MATGYAGALKSLFESGQYSDFTIRTPDKDFKIHRIMICLKSQYFAGIYGSMSPGAYNGQIDLEEPGWVIEALLRSVYEQPGMTSEVTADSSDWDIVAEVERLMLLYKAADKYQIHGFEPIKNQVSVLLDGIRSPHSLVSLGVRFWKGEFCLGPNAFLLSRVIVATSKKLQQILKDDGAWKLLRSSDGYLRATVSYLEASTRVESRGAVAGST